LKPIGLANRIWRQQIFGTVLLCEAIALGQQSAAVVMTGHPDVEKSMSHEERTEFEQFWNDRYSADTVLNTKNDVVDCEPKKWQLGPEFASLFPCMKKALENASTFTIRVRWHYTKNEDLRTVCFWKLSDGTTASWLLDPPVKLAADEALAWRHTNLPFFWAETGGFSYTPESFMDSRDLPLHLHIFSSLLQYPASPLGKSRSDLFFEFCDDEAFRPQIRQMCHIGDDSTGNTLAIQRQTGRIYFLDKDENLLGRKGVKTAAIGKDSPAVYVIERCETPVKLIETIAVHILDHIDQIKGVSDGLENSQQ